MGHHAMLTLSCDHERAALQISSPLDAVEAIGVLSPAAAPAPARHHRCSGARCPGPSQSDHRAALAGCTGSASSPANSKCRGVKQGRLCSLTAISHVGMLSTSFSVQRHVLTLLCYQGRDGTRVHLVATCIGRGTFWSGVGSQPTKL